MLRYMVLIATFSRKTTDCTYLGLSTNDARFERLGIVESVIAHRALVDEFDDF